MTIAAKDRVKGDLDHDDRMPHGSSREFNGTPNARATLTRTARDGFANPVSMRRIPAAPIPMWSAAFLWVQPRAMRKPRIRCPNVRASL